MPTEAPRPGEPAYPPKPDHAQLLEELAQVEHQLEALVRYREELRRKLERREPDAAG